ncbi:MAG: hypothetical protein K8F92_16575 [Hyphomicrobium sp.]|uniref:hypothetical protein n=1 Tax=Hyphomicrobium sp. TaxID=82 RepID=UPI0013216513|nr:hypothetical protein [Hyphomicrobium sp.]KAB2937045.1 MAG: hypothetical protein F9K20_20580 [Hyphomicrobium sp.]MBZ0211247.1 hypothetical protein [Hyphomicrobium sp.]
MPRAPRSLRAAVIAYIFAMAGLSFVALQLSLHVTAQVIALSLPHVLDKSPPPRSRIEQRRIEVAQAIPPMPVAKLAPSHQPAPSGVLAAQLDVAETESLLAEAEAPALRGVGRTKSRFRRVASRSDTPPAADAFNRNFGVLPIASN